MSNFWIFVVEYRMFVQEAVTEKGKSCVDFQN